MPALQAGEVGLAAEEAAAALEYAASERCPTDWKEWMGPLTELQADAVDAGREHDGVRVEVAEQLAIHRVRLVDVDPRKAQLHLGLAACGRTHVV